MEDSFTQWRNSSCQYNGDSTVVISDSDEDVDNSKEIDKQVIIDDSNDENNAASGNTTPKRWVFYSAIFYFASFSRDWNSDNVTTWKYSFEEETANDRRLRIFRYEKKWHWTQRDCLLY